MSLEKIYADYSDEQLVSVVENDGYTPEARKIAEQMLTGRGVPQQSLATYARAFFKEFFKKQFGSTILTSLAEPEFPKSRYLTSAELKKVAGDVYRELRSNRSDFYSNLPDG